MSVSLLWPKSVGARLLYSLERDLHHDFKNDNWIVDPRKKIFSTYKNNKLTPGQRQLLDTHCLCRNSNGFPECLRLCKETVPCMWLGPKL